MKAAALAYSPYGYIAGHVRQAPMLGYNGERCDPLIDTYALGQGIRSYSPALMRFHKPDDLSPFGLGGVNGYAYCAGDPLNYRDDTGRHRTFTQLRDFWAQQSSEPAQSPPKRSAPQALNTQATTRPTTPVEKRARAKRVGFVDVVMKTSFDPLEPTTLKDRLHQERQSLYIQEYEQRIKRNQKMLAELLDPSTLDFARGQGIKDKRYLAAVQKLDAWLDRAEQRLERLNARFESIRRG